jgi:prohibitin 2
MEPVMSRDFPVPPAALLAVLLLLAVVLGLGSCTVVDPGHRGVRVSMGKVDPNPLGEGTAFKLPFVTTVHEVNVQQQTVGGETSCFSKDLQTVKVKYALLYRVPESQVVKLYQEYKGDPYESLVEPRLQEALKQVTAVHPAEEMVQQRDVIRAAALEKVKQSVGEVITVVDLSIVNIDLSDQLEHAIEAKMVKQQESLAKTYELDKETKQAEITLVKAKAEAQAIEVTAAALAKSPNVIDLEVVKKWDGRSPTTLVVGGDAGGGAKVVFPVHGTQTAPPAEAGGAGR